MGILELVDRPADAASPGVCLERHPLLDSVRCQRLAGHPGPHGAEVETPSTEIYLEWPDAVARAG